MMRDNYCTVRGRIQNSKTEARKAAKKIFEKARFSGIHFLDTVLYCTVQYCDFSTRY